MDHTDLIDIAVQTLRPHTVKDRIIGDVAAALLTASGAIFRGVSVDTPGWGLCAERSAIAAMITAGEYRIARIVAVWQDAATHRIYVLPPCGICREFMRQVDPANLDCAIVLGRTHAAPLVDLLPLSSWPAFPA